MLDATGGSALFVNEPPCALFCRKVLILQLWEQLLELLKRRRSRLEKSMKLQRCFQEMINTIDWMDEIKVCAVTESVDDCFYRRFSVCLNSYSFWNISL